MLDTAAIAGNEYDANTANNTSHAETTIAPAVDLAVAKFTASSNLIELGGKITYTLIVTNNGPSPATGVTVTSPLGSATYVAGSGTATDSGTVSLQGSQIVASFTTLAANSTATVIYARHSRWHRPVYRVHQRHLEPGRH